MKKLVFLFLSLFICVVTITAQDQIGITEVKEEVFDKDYFRVQPDFYALNEDSIPIWYKVNFKAYEYDKYNKEYYEITSKPFYNVNPTNAEFEKTDEVIVMYDYESVHRHKKNYSGYKRIVIPSEVKYNGKVYKVTKIGDSAFRGSDVEEIILPNSINIFDWAFAYCSKLENIKLPNKTDYLGGRLFYNCKSITKVKLPTLTTDNEYNVKSDIFEKCKNLKEVDIDNTWGRTNIAFFSVDYVYNDANATFEECLNSYWFKITIRE